MGHAYAYATVHSLLNTTALQWVGIAAMKKWVPGASGQVIHAPLRRLESMFVKVALFRCASVARKSHLIVLPLVFRAFPHRHKTAVIVAKKVEEGNTFSRPAPDDIGGLGA
jgi:hypothetical protein